MTKKQKLATEVAEKTGKEFDVLIKLKPKELEEMLVEGEAPASSEKAPTIQAVELVDIIVKNGKVSFVYSDEHTEEVKFKKEKRELIYSIIRKAQFQINVASKPTPQKDKIQSIHNLTYTRICRIALDIDTITHTRAKELFTTCTVAEVLEHPAVDVIALKSIADAYCVTEKINRL